jgi:hypothetical protein
MVTNLKDSKYILSFHIGQSHFVIYLIPTFSWMSSGYCIQLLLESLNAVLFSYASFCKLVDLKQHKYIPSDREIRWLK